MGARLKSASINQTLRLALKALIASTLLYWLRSGGFSFWVALVFILAFGVFYLRPMLNNGKFIPSSLALLSIPFFSPVLASGGEFLFITSWGVSFFILLGVKNLVLIQRQKAYRIVHFGIIAALGTLLIERFGLTSQGLVFIALFLMFREFYSTVTESEGERPTLIAALEAFMFIEIAWIILFLSVDVLIGGAFLTLFVFIFHDTTTHRLAGSLSRAIVVRNAVLFAALTILISALSAIGALV